MATSSLEGLLGPEVWRARDAPAVRGFSTGHKALDAALPTGGLPQQGLIDVLLPGVGVGELMLILPTIARLTASAKDVALVSPPYVPYPPSWQAAGVDLQHLQIIDVGEKQAPWVFEQVLRSASCTAVVAWLDLADPAVLRRLQLAATEGRALAILLRDVKHLVNPSPAAVRIELRSDRYAVVRKCRGGVARSQPVPLHEIH